MSERLFDNHYSILEELERGPQIHTVRARHASLERNVQLRILNADLPTDEAEDARGRLRAHAVQLAKLRHSNLQLLYDFREGEQSYLVLSDVGGITLREHFDVRGGLPLRRAATLMKGALGALFAIHHAGLVQVGLDPTRLFLDDSDDTERLLILGLGSAPSASPNYLAPELREGGLASPASDVFAMGVVFIEMLTGRCQNALPSGLQKHALGPVISRAVDVELTTRYAHAGEFLAALESLSNAVFDDSIISTSVAPRRADGMRFRTLASIPAAPPLPEPADTLVDLPVVVGDEDLGVLANLFEGHHRVLVVDDDPEMRELIEMFLSAMNVEVISARNGAEGLQCAFTQQPDLILVDQLMPQMTGLEFLERLRQTPTVQAIPTIIVTSQSSIHDKVKGLQLGADDYITKPFAPQEFLARVGALLRRHNVHKIVDPVTKLPGPSALASHINDRLGGGVPFFLACLCVRHFQTYTSRHGFEAGTDLLSRTAGILYQSVTEHGRLQDFLGHINLNNFALVLSPVHGQAVCKNALRAFQNMRVQHDSSDARPVLNAALIEVQPTLIHSHRSFAGYVQRCLKEIKSLGKSTLVHFKNHSDKGTPIPFDS